MMECEVCQLDVPAGEYCGLCGAPLSEHRHDGPHWLRARSFSAAPGQHLLRLSITSSLFPHLSPRSRTSFMLGLVALVLALVATAMLRLPGALVAVAVLGLPVIFGIYLRESEFNQDAPRGNLWLTAGLAVALGVGWALLTGAVAARSYGIPLGAGIAAARMLRTGLGATLGGLLLMQVPTLVIRLVRPGHREALHGYAIGAHAAIYFTAAATLTRLAPQFGTGMVNRDRPLQGLLVEAGIRGLATPIIAATVGGLIGAALWFTRPPNKAHQHRGYVRLTLTLIAVIVAVVYALLGLIDAVQLPQFVQLAMYFGLTLVALLALRVGLHLALLHEAHDDYNMDEPLLCTQCGHVVPDAPFCAACGAATRASSRAARQSQRTDRPAPADSLTVGLLPGYSLHAPAYATTPTRTTKRVQVTLIFVLAAVVVAALLVGVSGLLEKPAVRYVCPPECGHPPMGQPVTINPRFTAPDGSFSVAYPATGSAYEVTKDDHGVLAKLLAGDGGMLQLFSRPATGRQPKDIAAELVKATYPDAKTAYEIPNAMVGYQTGYGIVADWYPQGASRQYSRMRLLVLVAVKNDLALIAAASGPYHRFGPDFGSGKPSAVGLQLALDMGQYVNSFAWRGDPAR
ncbi:zinc ribbon domain-containing protein [Mycolicibacterium mucogenicum DSM 44124]|uniref:Zinc ribbon domain-containing protein n=2 Tax=Mycobacteriaceae TaxID=1762 RepID=A0A8H2JL09_MYCMU|nr:zinc ribbon domain-containing protein [Mycolicibacterium mucogenicum DSM 44124]